jgi:glycosyltransferase involved in cell wall biosynthesis
MNILFLRTDFFGTLNTGGSFSHIGGFLDGLEELGHKVALTASAQTFPPEKYTFYHIPYSRLFTNFPEIPSIAYNRILERALPAIIRTEQPDFIYQRHSEFIHATTNIAHRAGLPLILEANNSEWWWKRNWAHLFFDRILRRSEERQFRAADAIMVVSEVLKQDLVRLFDLDPDKIHVNPNGVDISRFSDSIDSSSFYATLPAELQSRWKGKILCGFVGTFGEWHGVEVLARAVSHAVRRNPSLHFMLIGDGKLRGNVENILASNGVSDSVTLLGTVKHDKVPSYLSLCEILLSPHTENTDGTTFFGSPTKLFEYMGMGKAIVASSVGQIRDIIHDGINGALVEQRDEVALASVICRLADDLEFSRNLGKAARLDAVNTYSWRHNAQRAIDVYHTIKERE